PPIVARLVETISRVPAPCVEPVWQVPDLAVIGEHERCLDEGCGVRKRRAHRLSLAAAVAVIERQEDAERREMATADVAHGERHHRRFALLVVPPVLQSRDGLAELLAAAPRSPLPLVPERADR